MSTPRAASGAGSPVIIPFSPPNNTSNQPGGSELLDKLLVLLQNTFRSLADAVTNTALIGVKFDATAFPTGQRVFHGLDSQPTTWEPVNMQAPGGFVFEATTPNPNRNRYLVLQCSADLSCTIRFS
jgi:hypothetical protein